MRKFFERMKYYWCFHSLRNKDHERSSGFPVACHKSNETYCFTQVEIIQLQTGIQVSYQVTHVVFL